MEQEVLIEVNRVSKKFSKNIRSSMFNGMRDLMMTSVGLGSRNRSELRKNEFWALKDISFNIRRGEVVGLIGHNGAGKSTLLKLLNGLIRPDSGSIVLRGRVGALIELGTGFNPILSGRENIYINGQILGFSKEEIDAKVDSIIEFSEIEDFIDSPVQSYSSGMKVRLGFAVAAQMEPDVLILDEVLAVGDVGFRGKCMKAISQMMSKAAVIFVSHSMPMVNRYCNRGILLQKGSVLIDSSNVRDSIDTYLGSFKTEKSSNIYESGEIKLESFECNGSNLKEGYGIAEIFKDVEFGVRLKFNNNTINQLRIKINFIDRNHVIIASAISDHIALDSKDFIQLIMTISDINLRPEEYSLSLVVFVEDFTNALLIHDGNYHLRILGEKDYGGNSTVFKCSTKVI